MRVPLLIGSLGLFMTPADAQDAPLGSFIICPGNPRCPNGTSAQDPAPVQGSTTGARGFSLGRPATAARPRGRQTPSMSTPAPAEQDVGGTVRFEVGSVELGLLQRTRLDAIREYFDAVPESRMVIEGHVGPDEPAADAATLAGRRAQAVADHYARSGIAPERMELIAWTEPRPEGMGATAAGPRVEIRRAQ